MGLILNLQGISKHYGGVLALHNIRFSLKSGEVHCLCGENGSGKSTLVNIIAGLEEPEKVPGAGYFFDERFYSFGNPAQKLNMGIAVLYQDLALFPELTVSENIAMGEMAGMKRTIIPKNSLSRRVDAILRRYGLDLPTDEILENLSLGQRQLVAFARVLFKEPKVLVLDEPTSALPDDESRQIQTTIGQLKDEGCAILLISHKLDEVLRLADCISVLKDGRFVGRFSRGEVDEKELIYRMSGKELLSHTTSGERSFPEILRAESLAGRRMRNLSFSLGEGEILGIAGRLGSGRSRIAKLLFGLERISSGRLLLRGIPISIRRPSDAIEAGFGYVPENRIIQGLVLKHSVGNNIILAGLKRLRNRIGMLSHQTNRFLANEWISTLNIRTPSADIRAGALSGGNQQKSVLAKWMALDPDILILDKPTAGIDVATKNTVQELIHILADRGMGVIWISDDPAELLEHADRIIVLGNGRIAHRYRSDDTTLIELENAIRA